MLAGGTGVTPMFQVVNAILRDPLDKTELSLIFANVTEEDILLRKDLDTLAAVHPNFSVYYVLNKPSEGGRCAWEHKYDVVLLSVRILGAFVYHVPCGRGPDASQGNQMPEHRVYYRRHGFSTRECRSLCLEPWIQSKGSMWIEA